MIGVRAVGLVRVSVFEKLGIRCKPIRKSGDMAIGKLALEWSGVRQWGNGVRAVSAGRSGKWIVGQLGGWASRQSGDQY